MTILAGSRALACNSEQLAKERAERTSTTAGLLDKKGSPVEPQAIGMAWVLAYRSVAARAAPCFLTNAIKGVFGTVRTLDHSEALP
ncbi:hypothetical protein [Bradyrhizobium sp. USDA 4473]